VPAVAVHDRQVEARGGPHAHLCQQRPHLRAACITRVHSRRRTPAELRLSWGVGAATGAAGAVRRLAACSGWGGPARARAPRVRPAPAGARPRSPARAAGPCPARCARARPSWAHGARARALHSSARCAGARARWRAPAAGRAAQAGGRRAAAAPEVEQIRDQDVRARGHQRCRGAHARLPRRPVRRLWRRRRAGARGACGGLRGVAATVGVRRCGGRLLTRGLWPRRHEAGGRGAGRGQAATQHGAGAGGLFGRA